MTLLEKLEHDAGSRKFKHRKLVAKRILDLLKDWEEHRTGRDHFIFAHTFKTNAKLYRIFSDLSGEQVDRLDEVVEMLSNPRQ